jgi:hypothetical protein
MSEDQLRERLRALHAELGRAQVSQPETRALLRDLAGDIDRALEGEHGGLVERLRGAALHFEAEHPDLAQLTTRVIDALVKLGF